MSVLDKKYVGENSRNLKKRIYEHIRDFKKGNISNCLVKHNLKSNNFILKDFKMLVYIHNKKKVKR